MFETLICTWTRRLTGWINAIRKARGHDRLPTVRPPSGSSETNLIELASYPKSVTKATAVPPLCSMDLWPLPLKELRMKWSFHRRNKRGDRLLLNLRPPRPIILSPPSQPNRFSSLWSHRVHETPQLQTTDLSGSSSLSVPTISPATCGRSSFGLKSLLLMNPRGCSSTSRLMGKGTLPSRPRCSLPLLLPLRILSLRSSRLQPSNFLPGLSHFPGG